MAVQVGRMRAGAKGGKDSLLCGARGGWRACLLLGAAFWIHGEVDVFQAALDEAHRVGPLRHGVDALLHDDGCDVLEPSTQFHLPLFLRHLQRAYAFAGCLQSAAHERGRLMCGRWRLISDKAQLHGGQVHACHNTPVDVGWARGQAVYDVVNGRWSDEFRPANLPWLGSHGKSHLCLMCRKP